MEEVGFKNKVKKISLYNYLESPNRTTLPPSKVSKCHQNSCDLYLLHWQKYKWIFQIKASTYLTVRDTFVSQTLSTSDRAISSHDSYRHSNPISDARISMLLALSHSCYPPWILKLGGLESSGQRLIS